MTAWSIVRGGDRFRKGEHVENRNSGRHGVVTKVLQVYLVKWEGKRGPAMTADAGDLYHLRRVRRPLVASWILDEYSYERDVQSAVLQLREIGYSATAAFKAVMKVKID